LRIVKTPNRKTEIINQFALNIGLEPVIYRLFSVNYPLWAILTVSNKKNSFDFRISDLFNRKSAI